VYLPLAWDACLRLDQIPSPHLVLEWMKTYSSRKSTLIVLQLTWFLTSLHGCWNRPDFSYPCTYLERSRRFLLLFSNQNSSNFCLNMMAIIAFSLMDLRLDILQELEPSWHLNCVKNAYRTTSQFLSGSLRTNIGTRHGTSVYRQSTPVPFWLSVMSAKSKISHIFSLYRFYVACMVYY